MKNIKNDIRGLNLKIEDLSTKRYDEYNKHYIYKDFLSEVNNKEIGQFFTGNIDYIELKLSDVDDIVNTDQMCEMLESFIDENDILHYNNLPDEQKLIINDFVKDVMSKIDVDRSNYNYDKYIKKIDDELQEIENNIKELNNKLIPYQDDYLQQLYNIALEELRKKCFKYSRVNHFKDMEEVKWSYTRNWNVVGSFNVESREIIVDKNLLFENNLTTNFRGEQGKLNRKIVNTLKHEIMHRYVADSFGKNETNDANPIFMSMLLYANPDEDNAYECFRDFKQTYTYKELMKSETFNILEVKLFKLKRKIDKLIVSEMTRSKIFLTTPKTDKYNFEYEYEEYFTVDQFNHTYCLGIDWLKYVEDNMILTDDILDMIEKRDGNIVKLDFDKIKNFVNENGRAV